MGFPPKFAEGLVSLIQPKTSVGLPILQKILGWTREEIPFKRWGSC